MEKETWKAGNMLYPLPAVMVSVSDGEGNDNIITVAWAGTVCTNPPMVSISVRPSRFSYDMLRKTGEFVINLTTEKLAYATDYCGVRSGRDVDKFKEMNLHKEKANFVTLGADQQIDFGGIAKGYTGQKLAELFQEYGVSSALVSLGGNIQAIGTKPDGSSWKVGIRDPKGGQQDYIGVLFVENQAVVTSGGYERYFEEDGKTYIHIINPRTGYPADGDLLSVTIVSRDGTLADGMSTALYIMGYEKACQFWRQHREEFNVILVTDDGKIHISENLKENFQTECDLEMIESGSE